MRQDDWPPVGNTVLNICNAQDASIHKAYLGERLDTCVEARHHCKVVRPYLPHAMLVRTLYCVLREAL